MTAAIEVIEWNDARFPGGGPPAIFKAFHQTAAAARGGGGKPAKDKLIRAAPRTRGFGSLSERGGGSVFSSEKSDQTDQGRILGIDDAWRAWLWGVPCRRVYSAPRRSPSSSSPTRREAAPTEFRPDSMYLDDDGLHPAPQHAPGDPCGHASPPCIAAYLAELDALELAIVITADHGMSQAQGRTARRMSSICSGNLLDDWLGKAAAGVDPCRFTASLCRPSRRARLFRHGLSCRDGGPCGTS